MSYCSGYKWLLHPSGHLLIGWPNLLLSLSSCSSMHYDEILSTACSEFFLRLVTVGCSMGGMKMNAGNSMKTRKIFIEMANVATSTESGLNTIALS